MRVFDYENKWRYFGALIYLYMFGRTNTMQMIDIGKLSKKRRFIGNK